MEPGRLHRKRWPPSIGTRGRVQLDCMAAIVGIRSERVSCGDIDETGVCVACGLKDGLQHHYLVTREEGGSDDEWNLITSCVGCHDKLHWRQSRRIKAGLARAVAGKKLGRPRAKGATIKRILELRSQGMGMVAIARKPRCGSGTVHTSIWRLAVLHQCIRPLIGAFAPGHHGYQRAIDLINGQASIEPSGSPVFDRAGKTDLHLLVLSRRPR